MPTDAALETAPRAKRARREKSTRRSVLIADKVADWTITVGGLGVIVAVFGIMAFLVNVVIPLFTGGSVEGLRSGRAPAIVGAPLAALVDDYKTVMIEVSDRGEVKILHLDSGSLLEAPRFELGDSRVTSFVRTPTGSDLAFGLADGTVRFGKIEIATRPLRNADLPDGLRPVGPRDKTDGRILYSPLPGDQHRRMEIRLALGEPQKISEGSPIVALDYRRGGTTERPTEAFVSVDSTGVVRLSRSETRINLLTRRATVSTATATLPALPAGARAVDALMTDKADQVYVAERSGMVHRYDTRSFEQPMLAESVRLTPPGVELTAFAFLIGEQSMVVGAADGSVDVWFRLQQAGAKSSDGYTLVRAHRMEKHAAAVTHLDASQRSKMFATADANGDVWLRHSTSEQTVLKLKAETGAAGPLRALSLSPRDNGILALSETGLWRAWDVSAPHPETTWSSIFGKVWYEGYSKPELTWQSSSGTDSFEPKFSLVPLIFGTLKATIYALLFAIPIALMAAIYTSEFLTPGARSVVKPAMEMMASLPSVVLGFIAALILAPLVETWIGAVVLAFVVLPLALTAAAYLWQLLPRPLALRWGVWPKLGFMFAVVIGAVELSIALSGPFERAFFGGDFKAWAGGRVGTAAPFLALVLVPLCFAGLTFALERLAGARLATALRSLPRQRAAFLDAGRWLALLVASILLAAVLAQALAGAGVDARGGVIDTYVQRNTLVVGFAMGFAVIPIIYTIAEDALNAVPEHLRAASLGCGATPWQTATRVILPTAMSGVFAAIMVGMGRAVGETMIVVMAAGNTPVLDWNVFNGLRALSANIAVELPEAVRDDTLYRMLFLAALTLFVMTFAINTAAELVRQRFRKRAAQL